MPLREAGPGERYRTRMELEPHVALHQLGFLRRAQQEEENATPSTEQELRAKTSPVQADLSNLTLRDGVRATPGFPGCL